jgi:hypothetical protein
MLGGAAAYRIVSSVVDFAVLIAPNLTSRHGAKVHIIKIEFPAPDCTKAMPAQQRLGSSCW